MPASSTITTRPPLFVVNADRLNPIDDEYAFRLLTEHLQGMRGHREYLGYNQ